MFFVLSKILSPLVDPGAILMTLLIAGLLLVATRRRVRAGRVLIAAAAVWGLAVAALPIDAWIGRPLEKRFPPVRALPATVDGILLLGGSIDPKATAERGQLALNETAERITAFIELARRYPQARLVFTGGSGALLEGRYKEADALKAHIGALGIDPGRIQFERESRNTQENAVITQAMVRPKAGETWLLVTSALHMPRAVGCFRRVGWPVRAYPVDYRFAPETPLLRFDLGGGLTRLSAVLHEWIGLGAYRLVGSTEALFPAPE